MATSTAETNQTSTTAVTWRNPSVQQTTSDARVDNVSTVDLSVTVSAIVQTQKMKRIVFLQFAKTQSSGESASSVSILELT